MRSKKQSGSEVTAEGQASDVQRALAHFFDSSPLGVIFHRSHKPLYVNRAWAEAHGYRRDEVAKLDSVLPLIAPQERVRLLAYFSRRIVGEDAPECYRYRAVHRSGDLVMLEAFVQNLRWDGQEVVQETVLEVADQPTTAEVLLKNAEDNYRRLSTAVEHSMDGYALWGPDERLVLCNDQFLMMVPDAVDMLVPGVDFEATLRRRVEQKKVKEAIGREEEWVAERLRRHRNPGGTLDLSLQDGRWVQLRDQAMSDGGVLVIATDITDRKRAEQELADYKERLEDLVELRTKEVNDQKKKLEAALLAERELSGLQRQFVNMVSHEFRTPLTIIDGTAQRIQRRFDRLGREKIERDLANVRNSVDRLVQLMESVLAVSDLEEGRIAFEPEPCDVAVMLAELAESVAYLNPGYDITVDLAELPGTVHADPTLLRQVFSNLFSNAVKYSQDGTSIAVVGCQSGPGRVTIEVRDQGTGIRQDELQKIFQRFYRATNSTGTAGSGLGLHLSQYFIQMHSGEISVQSEPDEGSVFTVHLPVEQSNESHVLPAIRQRARDVEAGTPPCAAIDPVNSAVH